MAWICLLAACGSSGGVTGQDTDSTTTTGTGGPATATAQTMGATESTGLETQGPTTGSESDSGLSSGDLAGECGDGTVQPGEDCDAGGESATCNADCTAAGCGDAVINQAAGEDCDDGRNGDEDDGCTDACRFPACGDGVVQPSEGEECDGVAKNGVCSGDCTLAQWGMPRLLENGGPELIGAPQLATDPSGNAIVVWRSDAGSFAHGVRSQRYDIATDTWGEATQLDAATDSAGIPSIAMDTVGNAIAVWGDTTPGNAPIAAVARRYDVATGTWEPITVILPDGGGFSAFPVAFDAADNATVLVPLPDGSTTDLFAVRRDAATGTWQGSVGLESGDVSVQGSKLAVNASGSAFAVWTSETTPGQSQPRDIFASHYDADADAWGVPVPIEALNPADAFEVSVGIDDNGNAIATWSQRDGVAPAQWNIYTNRYDAVADAWGAPMLLDPDDVGDARFSDLSVSPSGNAIAVWHRQSPLSRDVFARRYDATSDTWARTVLLDSGDGVASTPRVDQNNAGNGIAVWFQFNDAASANEILASHYDPTSDTWGGELVIASENGVDDASPQVEVHPSGTAVASWRRNAAGAGYSAMAAHFQ